MSMFRSNKKMNHDNINAYHIGRLALVVEQEGSKWLEKWFFNKKNVNFQTPVALKEQTYLQTGYTNYRFTSQTQHPLLLSNPPLFL